MFALLVVSAFIAFGYGIAEEKDVVLAGYVKDAVASRSLGDELSNLPKRGATFCGIKKLDVERRKIRPRPGGPRRRNIAPARRARAPYPAR